MAGKKWVRSAAGYDNQRCRGHDRAAANLSRSLAPTRPTNTYRARGPMYLELQLSPCAARQYTKTPFPLPPSL